MSDRARSRPALPDRLLAASCYLGLAPLLGWLRRCRVDPFLRHHHAQALAVVLVGATLLLAGLGLAVGWAWVIIHHRKVVESLPHTFDWVFTSLVVLLPVAAWGAGLVYAVAGSVRPLPLVGRLARRPGARRLGLAAHGLAYALVALVVGLGLHASALCETRGPAPVYVLYDDMGVAPRWLFQLGAYRIARAGDDRWGPGSVAVLPLDEANLAAGLREARVLILLCHGRDGLITTDDFAVLAPPCAVPGETPLSETTHALYVQEFSPRPGQWRALPVGGSLRLAYITACDGGRHADRWQQALAPAEVVTFDRLSAMLEHAWWLWCAGPGRVRDLPG
jgi:hypothetical protein